MKKILFPLITLLLSVTPVLALQSGQDLLSQQSMGLGILEEMRKTDPDAAQNMESAMTRGDFSGAKKIYEEFKRNKNQEPSIDAEILERLTDAVRKGDMLGAQRILMEQERLRQKNAGMSIGGGEYSVFERTLSGTHPSAELMLEGLQQFGYDVFMNTVGSFSPSQDAPVSPDYILGPGDQFTLTLWGTTEGIYSLQVRKEGTITLPKVGVVPVSGVRFRDLEHTLRRHLSRYYSNFNLSVAMGSLKTIMVYVVGEVNKPGSYSLSSLTTAYGALFAAGGPSKKGTLRSIRLLRNGRAVKTIDLYEFLLKGDRSQDLKLQQDDTLFIPLIGPVAGVAGAVYRPAIYELKGRETLEEVINTAGGIMPIALGGRLQLTRYADNEKKTILDITLNNGQTGRKDQADELGEKVRNMDLIAIRPVYDKVWETVNLSGEVAHPGDFQWRPDLGVKEIIGQGGLLPTSDLRRAEVIRLKKDLDDREIISIDLAALMNNDQAQNVLLRPQDQVRVYTMYRKAQKVTITGEVQRPGVYEIMNGERLSDLLRRAGGFTPEAYPYGVVYTRKGVKDTQARNMQTFVGRMESQVLQTAAAGASTALSADDATLAKTEHSLNQSLLDNLKKMQEQLEGRVAISITEHIEEWTGSREDLLLQDSDRIVVPKRPQEVMLMGEVHSPGAQIHVAGFTVREYINLGGGYTDYAEKKHVFVLKANGFAYSSSSPSVGNIEKLRLDAGDTIFVPQELERRAGLRTTKDIVDILFKAAVVLATITVIF